MRESLPNSIAPTPAAHHRFHLLDGLRGVAAVLVVYWHAPNYLLSVDGHANYLAVDFFFCLSGFVVSFAYERRLREAMTLSRFVLARLIRLYPTYLLALVVGIPVFLFILLPRPILHAHSPRLALLVLTQVVMLPNLGLYASSSLFPVLIPGWSLFFELLANIAFGILVTLRRDSLVYLVLIYLMALMAMIYWSHFHFSVDVGSDSSFRSLCGGIARVSLSFSAGVLVQRLYKRLEYRALVTRFGDWLAFALGVILPILLLTPFPFMQTQLYMLALLAVGFPSLVLTGALCRPSRRWLPLCTLMGELSYPIYLLHHPLLMLLWAQPVHSLLTPYAAEGIWIISLIALFVAALSYAAVRFYEIPLRKQLTRWSNSTLAPAPTFN